MYLFSLNLLLAKHIVLQKKSSLANLVPRAILKK